MLLPELILQWTLCPSILVPGSGLGKDFCLWAGRGGCRKDCQPRQMGRCGLCCAGPADGAGTLPQPRCSQMYLPEGSGPVLAAPWQGWVATSSSVVLALHSWHRCSTGTCQRDRVRPYCPHLRGVMVAGKGLERSMGLHKSKIPSLEAPEKQLCCDCSVSWGRWATSVLGRSQGTGRGAGAGNGKLDLPIPAGGVHSSGAHLRCWPDRTSAQCLVSELYGPEQWHTDTLS